MTTEFVLLLVISWWIFFHTFATAGQEMLQSGVPQLAIRMEKHLITGHLFSVKAGGGSPIWEEP